MANTQGADDMASAKLEATILVSKNSQLRRDLKKAAADSVSAVTARTITLTIRGIRQDIELTAQRPEVMLGRADPARNFLPDVDLSRFGAVERGVSRNHAKLHLDGQQLYVTDQGSYNGTRVAGKQLASYERHQLRSGDELMLGRLLVLVSFD